METNIVHFKDARDMSEVDDNSVRLIITSPPYWNVKDYSKGRTQEVQHSEKVEGQIGDIDDYNSYINEMLLVWKECERVLKPNGKLCINTPIMPILKAILTTHYNRHIVDINASIEHSILNGTGLFLYDTYIWNKINSHIDIMFGSYPYPPNFYVRNSIEFITIFVKDGEPEKISKEIKEKDKLNQEDFIEYTKQIWDIPTQGQGDKDFGMHPAMFPIELPKRLIRMFSFTNDIILDPFTGSGTTLSAAKQFGRRYIGYEIYRSYEQAINNRLDVSYIF